MFFKNIYTVLVVLTSFNRVDAPDVKSGLIVDGILVSPLVISRFAPAAGENEAITRQISLTASSANRNSKEQVKVLADGTIFAFVPDSRPQQYVSYKCLGTLDNGDRIVLHAWNGGGSGIFYTLLVLRVQEEKTLNLEPESRPKEKISTLRGYFSLGDRDSGAINLVGNKIIIGSSVHRKNTVSIDID